MAVSIDLAAARALLSDALLQAEEFEREGVADRADPTLTDALTTIMASQTSAFRQALVGTTLVRLMSGAADLKLPATEHGESAYSGRTIDESVVMPLFAERRIPVSQSSAYLSTLRRGKRFVDEDATGVRDRATFLATNVVVAWLQHAGAEEVRTVLVALLRGFLRLREARRISLIDVRRLSLSQLDMLTRRLLAVPSGGRIPMIIVMSALAALDQALGLKWEIESQGINAADKSNGSVGDITVYREGEIVLGIEVTERRVEDVRVRTAMNEKVMPAGVTDYLYLVTVAPSSAAQDLAQAYFGQGHDVNFVDIADWISLVLSLGAECRTLYFTFLRATLAQDDTPVGLKVAWNEIVSSLI